MSDIKLVSEGYTSKFVTGPELTEKLGQKQDKLTASTGINLYGSTISVNTAASVGTSNLPVTASAVNTKLNGYVTTTQLNNKQDRLSWYSESDNYPYKADMAANEVTLRAGWDTTGIIVENAKISLSQEEGQISITSNFGGNDHSHLNILKTEKEPSSSPSGYNEKIVIGDSNNSTSIFVAGPLYDKNRKEITGGSSSFNYISEREGSHTSLLLGSGVGGNVRSVFVCGPLYGNDGTIFVSGPIVFNEAYDKDGNEITGGGGGGSDRVTTDADGRTVILGRNGELTIGTDGEFDGELGSPMIYASESGILYIGGVDNFINFFQNYTAVDGHVIRIKIGTEMLVLNQAKLQKLKQLLES